MTLDQQIAELKREIALRKNVYPKWVANSKMRQSEMDHHIGAMTAALHTLMAVKRLRATFAEHRHIHGDTMDGVPDSCACGWECKTEDGPNAQPYSEWLDHVFERSKAAAEAEATT